MKYMPQKKVKKNRINNEDVLSVFFIYHNFFLCLQKVNRNKRHKTCIKHSKKKSLSLQFFIQLCQIVPQHISWG